MVQTVQGGPFIGVIGTASTVTGCIREAGTADGGTSVAVTGTGFLGEPTVRFGGVLADPDQVTIVSSTRLTCVTPAHAVGVVDIVVGEATGSQLFEYLPAPTITYASYSDNVAMTGFTTDLNAGCTCAVSTDIPQPGKTYSIKVARVGASSGLVAKLQKSLANNPPLNEANGFYLKWKQLIPTASVNAVTGAGGQMKTHLMRNEPPTKDFTMWGIGTGFAGPTGTLCIQDDPTTGDTWKKTNNASYGDDVWVEHICWMKRTSGVSCAVRAWINGVEPFAEQTMAAMGSDLTTETLYCWLGFAYIVSSTDAQTYLDEITLTNGYPV